MKISAKTTATAKTTTQTISIYDQEAIERLRAELRLDPEYVRRLRIALLKRFQSDEVALQALPVELRSAFFDRVATHALEPYRQCDSTVDGATKLLFRTQKGLLLESVLLRIATGRTTLCVSSQVGCAAACEFCATGHMGIARDLSVEEILDQVVRAGQLLSCEDRKLRNIVFMGMGEPFHNEANLHKALTALTAPELFHHPPTKVLVSTVGIPAAMIRCARRFPTINQALSLHSVRQKVRERLIPLAKKHTLPELQSALAEINAIQKTTVMIEYLLLAGMNDSADDARDLIAWLSDLNVHVNLIPYNPIDDAPQLAGTQLAGRNAFAERLKQAGLKTTIRYSLGADIAAACGQLVRQENQEIARNHTT